MNVAGPVQTSMAESRWRGKAQSVLLTAGLFYITLYLPLSWVVYWPHWHGIYNDRLNDRVERFGVQEARRGIAELHRYLRHQGGLQYVRWSGKEKIHLSEVRAIMDGVTVAALAASVLLLFTCRRERFARAARRNVVMVSTLLLILPVFAPFWRHVFHPLLFENRLWINTPKDFSYWIMPRQFFQYSTGLVIVSAALLNLLAWRLSARKKRRI